MGSTTPPAISPRELEAYLHEKIPLSLAMGMQVIECAARVVLTAPLAPKINHLGTAFGGSLTTLPTLACYAALWIVLRENGVEGHVVVKRSQTNYLHPVTAELRTLCVRPSAEAEARFTQDLRRHKKARLELKATVAGTQGKAAVEFQGTFVALL